MLTKEKKKQLLDTKVTIIMLARNSMPHIVHTVESIIKYRTFPTRLLIVCAKSDDGTGKYCDWLSKHYSNIKVLHTKKEGVIKAFNRGIKHVKDRDVLLIHDDVIFPSLYLNDWLWELVKYNQYDDCGLVIPLNGGGISGPEYLEGLTWAGTWCMYIPRKTIDKIGIFDEKFHPGNGEDIDYSYRVHLIDKKIYRTEFGVDHHRRTEHSSDGDMNVQKVIKKNAKYFRKKHGLDKKK